MRYLEVSNLSKNFGSTRIFNAINFQIDEGAFVTLLGPSGCGKSTLLRCIAGLTPFDAGSIRVGGDDITHAPPQKRGIGMVFQSYALFPNMTVQENTAFGLKMQGIAADERAQRVAEILDLVELRAHENKWVHQLSGGQRQRVALARALVVRPRILLLDEPFSALDARIRKSLQDEVRRIQLQLKLTTIFVTHDQEEAMILSDRIFLMDGGRMVQDGSAEAVYTRPTSRVAARFMGNYNLLDAGQAKTLFGLEIKDQLAIRPESIDVVTPSVGDANPATILRHQLLGNVIRYQVDAAGVPLTVDVLNRSAASLLPDGTAVALEFNPEEFQEVA